MNPFAVDELAAAMAVAIEMPAVERTRRMRRMREHVARHNVYRWGAKVLSELLRIDIPDGA